MTIVIPSILFIVLVTIYFTLKFYSNIKLFVADAIGLVGWLNKGLRKASVKNEYEGIINEIVNDFNSNFGKPILPNCQIIWVKEEERQAFLKNNEAVICLSFNKRDHDLNLYNATSSFVQTGILPFTKTFLEEATKKAIDLLSTKIVLKKLRRRLLSLFNENLVLENSDTREQFRRLDETDRKGLFQQILIPELHYVGETLKETSPSNETKIELESFVDWFYDIATREYDDRSTLKFEGNYIKVGVILVAKHENWEKYGAPAYTKWAHKYAAQEYDGIYILARGEKRGKIADLIAKNLLESSSFEIINKNTKVKKKASDGSEILITCIGIRPDIHKIKFDAWQRLKKDFDNKIHVNTIIQKVFEDKIIVNAYGQNVFIEKENLSATEIRDISKYFKEEQELVVKIQNIDLERQTIELANKDTDTDPKKIADSFLEEDKTYFVTVDSIKKKDLLETGIMCKNVNSPIQVFIPRNNATYGRFTKLSDKYPFGCKLEVRLIEFSYDYGNYIGEIVGLVNPWLPSNLSKYTEGTKTIASIREITETYMTCELQEGLEGRIYKNEISWQEREQTTTKFKPGEQLELMIYKIDKKNFKIFLSKKRLTKSDKEKLLESHKDQILHGKISRIKEGFGINVKLFTNPTVECYIPIRELMWGYCDKIQNNFKIEQEIKVLMLNYEHESDLLVGSLKNVYKNDFEKIAHKINIQDHFVGKVLEHHSQITRIELNVYNNILQGYVHKSEISNICFLNQNDLPNYLVAGQKYDFVVKRVDGQNKIIELERKSILNKNISKLEYGNSYAAKVVKKNITKVYVYSNLIEGTIDSYSLRIGEEIEVIPANIDRKEFTLLKSQK